MTIIKTEELPETAEAYWFRVTLEDGTTRVLSIPKHSS